MTPRNVPTSSIWLLGILVAVLPVAKVVAEPLELYVAPDGDDRWSGTLEQPNADRRDGPFATLDRSRDVIRSLIAAGRIPREGVRVVVRGGDYFIERPLALTEADSGAADRPIVYCAEPGASVRLIGGKRVMSWRSVVDKAIVDRLDPAAVGQLLCADLSALEIDDFGSPSGGGVELFFNEQPMTLSRWPNQDFVSIVDVLGPSEVDVRGTKGRAEGIFQYAGDRPKRWMAEADAWVHGYWFWDWSEQRHRIKSIDPNRQTIEVEPPYHGYGYRKGQWFYAYNLLSEIDRPGEWYLDRKHQQLYFWPPAPLSDGEAILSVLPTLITLDNVSHVTLRGFTIEAVRGTAVHVSDGTSNRVIGCTFRNTGEAAVRVAGGTDHGVIGCDIYQTGGGGISLSGGDRVTLTPAKHFADNNHIHHFARVTRVYQPAIMLQGVGNRATHNLIHDAPHMGIGFGGNDHLIEFNEIHHVCEESNDAGAIYTGRNWTMRGTVIRYNYLHDITGFQDRGCVGVYLDDMFCGTEISSNLFHRVTRAAFIGGGRDCLVSNNLFVDCRPALHIDARALGWAHDHADEWIREGNSKGTLSGIHYQQSPYRERYPELVVILEDEPAAPKGNRVYANVAVGGEWDNIEPRARSYQSIEHNLVGVDPGFEAADKLQNDQVLAATDFRLKADSPAWQIGFKPLPLDQIGLYDDECRASSPVPGPRR